METMQRNECNVNNWQHATNDRLFETVRQWAITIRQNNERTARSRGTSQRDLSFEDERATRFKEKRQMNGIRLLGSRMERAEQRAGKRKRLGSQIVRSFSRNTRHCFLGERLV